MSQIPNDPRFISGYGADHYPYTVDELVPQNGIPGQIHPTGEVVRGISEDNVVRLLRRSSRPPHVLYTELQASWHNSAFDPVYGPNPAAGRYRCVIQTRLCDTRPYLGQEFARGHADVTQRIETGDYGGVFDMASTIYVQPQAAGVVQLSDLTDFLSLDVFTFQFGHPVDPQMSRVYETRQDVTAQFHAEANAAWSYSWVASGMRFWGTGLVLEADSAIPLTFYLTMH